MSVQSLHPFNQHVKNSKELKVQVKMVKIVKKLIEMAEKVCSAALNCPNKNRFDPEFYGLLKILFSFGIYQPKPTKKRIAFGVLMILFLFVTFLMGCIKNALVGLHEENFNKAFINGACFCFVFPVLVLVVSFMRNRIKFIRMLRDLHTIHSFYEEGSMEVLSRKCLKIVKAYRAFMAILCFTLITFHALGLKVFRLIMPSIYDLLADGPFYYILVTVNSVHLLCLALVMTVCDLILILCIIRLKEKVKFLCHNLRNCTDSNLFHRNKRKLVRCVQYHATLIR